ncbi:MAG TPA: methionyl-tRNA formyltransferase [Methanocorpusculum sp.]|nr:methionyl-tRNA formyltransferase [Methanocorpusculum sp.]
MSKLRVLFMGTPEYAVPSLEAVSAKYDVVGVVTRADKPNRRGNRIEFSPVKAYALAHDIPVFQPESLKDDALYEELSALKPDISAVVAYGMLIPKRIIDLPRISTINVHGSVLPKYRGAAPMQYSVLNGDKTAGVTVMHVSEGLDAGDIILSREIPVGENETFGELHDRLSVLGAEALVEAISELEAGTAQRIAQNPAEVSFAPSISKEECVIDWSRPAQSVHNRVRGLSPIPGAVTHMSDGKLLKVYRTKLIDGYSGTPGEILAVLKKEGLVVACGSGAVCMISAKPEGKREMPAVELANGHYVAVGDVFK